MIYNAFCLNFLQFVSIIQTELNSLDQSIHEIKNLFEKAIAEERRLKSELSSTQSEPTDADLGR